MADSDQRATDSGAPDSNPRAFATATGLVFQVVGLLLTLSGCCLWTTSEHYQDYTSTPIESPRDYLKDPAKTTAMVAIVASFTGGLGLLAAGVGLQGEHPRSGTAALIVSGGLAAVWWGCLIAFLAAGGSLLQCVLAILMALASTILFLLAGASARVLSLYPPPADRNVAPAELFRNRHD